MMGIMRQVMMMVLVLMMVVVKGEGTAIKDGVGRNDMEDLNTGWQPTWDRNCSRTNSSFEAPGRDVWEPPEYVLSRSQFEFCVNCIFSTRAVYILPSEKVNFSRALRVTCGSFPLPLREIPYVMHIILHYSECSQEFVLRRFTQDRIRHQRNGHYYFNGVFCSRFPNMFPQMNSTLPPLLLPSDWEVDHSGYRTRRQLREQGLQPYVPFRFDLTPMGLLGPFLGA